MQVIVRLLEVSELDRILPLIRQLNPTLDEATLRSRLDTVRASQNYRCAGAFVGETLVGVTGIWTGTKLWCGKFIEADNVVVDVQHRGQGIGEKLMTFVHDLGRREGCEVAVLDTYVTFSRAQKFYFEQGYDIRGFHFVRELK
jgi:GNAT superfamily N-acetyltransferase